MEWEKGKEDGAIWGRKKKKGHTNVINNNNNIIFLE